MKLIRNWCLILIAFHVHLGFMRLNDRIGSRKARPIPFFFSVKKDRIVWRGIPGGYHDHCPG
jgi:hypothetical protein